MDDAVGHEQARRQRPDAVRRAHAPAPSPTRVARAERAHPGPTRSRAVRREVADAIREGAEGFLRTQYSSIAKYAVVMAAVLFLLYLTKPPAHAEISTFSTALLTTATFCQNLCLFLC